MKKTGSYKNCEKCSKPYYAYLYNFDKRRFCSSQCANVATSIQQSDTKRSQAKKNVGNKVKWRYNVLYIEWRNKCLVRDNFTCQNCNNVLNSRIAVVHHPKSWRDYPDNRYDIDNGVTLCRSCHNRIHVLPSRKQRSGF